MLRIANARPLTSTALDVTWEAQSQPDAVGSDAGYHAYLSSARNSPSPLSEIVILPGPIEALDDCWDISVSTKEESGVYSRLTGLLSEKDINILHSRCATMMQSRAHTMSLLVDCRRYKSAIDKKSSYRSSSPDAELKQLSWDIFLEFPTEVCLTHGGPSIHINRNYPLWEQAQRISAHADYILAHERLQERDGKIDLPEHYLELIRSSYNDHHSIALDSNPMVVVTRDEGFVIKVFIYYHEAGIAEIYCTHNNMPGALNAMGEFFHKNGWNILMNISSVLNGRSKMASRFLVQKLPSQLPVSSENLRADLYSAIEAQKTERWTSEFQPEWVIPHGRPN